MKISSNPARRCAHRPSLLPMLPTVLIAVVAAISFLSTMHASAAPARLQIANDNCGTATVINPAALPFTQDSTTDGALNDVDPGGGGCAPGPGPDVVYSFTPTVSGAYTIGATPFAPGFDLSLYVITDCANPLAGCLGGANANGFGRGETLTLNLSAGTQYFIIIDSPATENSEGPFHFSLRSGTPSNDTCATPIILDPTRIGFETAGTTFGAANDLNPGTPCVRTNQSARGPDVVYRFTPVDTQNYDIIVTPVAGYDTTVYVVTNCASLANCSSADSGGPGETETLRRRLEAGVTYFIIIDGFQTDAGDFSFAVVPTIPLAPAAPSNLTATAVSSTRIDLTWQDNSNNELGFRLERSTDGTNFTEIATLDPNVTSFSDTTVSPSTTYFYRVFAFNNFGSSNPTNIADATTPANPAPPRGVIMVTPVPVDFGSVAAGQTATQTVTIRNDGGVDLVISAITDPEGPFSILNRPTLPLTLTPGQSIQLTVQFAPPSVRSFAGIFLIQSNDPLTPSFVVTLLGVGAPAPVPNLDLSTGLINFSSGSSSLGLIIRNTGNANLLITSISTPAAPFTISGRPQFPLTLRPGESIVLGVAFSPGAVGVFQSSITIVSNDPDQLITVIPLLGTSTSTNEQLKLRAPTQVTAVAGQTTTLAVIATNGTNSDIDLEASELAGATFTESAGGRGSFVFTPAAGTTGTFLVTFTARDGAGRVKTLQSVITVLAAANTHGVRVSWTAPAAAPGAPTGVQATDLSITALAESAATVEPAQAAGLAGYVIYRSRTPGVVVSLSNIVGVAAANQTSFTDTVPEPPGSAQVFFYAVTALYSSGTESATSNETSTAPRMVGLDIRKKALRFVAANSNVAVGAVLIVDGRETFQLTRDGDFIVVGKNARSTPGNLRIRDIFSGNSSHTVQVRNPNGATSAVQTLSK